MRNESTNFFGKEMFPNQPQTKRHMFFILIEFINRYINNPKRGFFEDLVIGISGPRHCGKSTILYQLANALGSDVVYYREYLDNDTFCSLYTDVISSDKKVVLIDEVCKASNEAQLHFCSDVKKLQTSGVITIYTGSTEKALRSLQNSIGRGDLYNIDIISYAEYLFWLSTKSNFLEMSLDDFLANASTDTLKDYLRFLKPVPNIDSYMYNVVNDTAISYKNRFLEDLNFEQTDFDTLLKYLSIKGIFDNTTVFEDIVNNGEIDRDLNQRIQEVNEEFHSLDKDAVNSYITLLKDSAVLDISATPIIKNLTIDDETFSNIDGKRHYIFAYPWIYTEKIAKSLSLTNRQVEAIWMETVLTKDLSKLYEFAGKLRVEDFYEIDILCSPYGSKSTLFSVEVKDRPYNSAQKAQRFSNLLATALNCEDYVFTYSDLNKAHHYPTENAIANYELILYCELFYLYKAIYIYLARIDMYYHQIDIKPSKLKEAVNYICPLVTKKALQSDIKGNPIFN